MLPTKSPCDDTSLPPLPCMESMNDLVLMCKSIRCDMEKNTNMRALTCTQQSLDATPSIHSCLPSNYLFVLVYLLKSLVHTLLYIWPSLKPNTLKQYWDYSSHLHRSSEGCVFTAAGRPSIITRSSEDSFLSVQKQL